MRSAFDLRGQPPGAIGPRPRSRYDDDKFLRDLAEVLEAIINREMDKLRAELHLPPRRAPELTPIPIRAGREAERG